MTFKTSINGARFFTDHYMKVWREREKRNLPMLMDFQFSNNGEVVDHHLKGRYLIMNKTLYCIQSVHRHWELGWYHSLCLRKSRTKSHGVVIWESIDSKSEFILNEARETKENVQLI